MTTPRYINITETAKIVRAELKAAFPRAGFSVRASKYSMGCHLEIVWVDGPTREEVAAIADKFYGTGFDGMTDSTTSKRARSPRPRGVSQQGAWRGLSRAPRLPQRFPKGRTPHRGDGRLPLAHRGGGAAFRRGRRP